MGEQFEKMGRKSKLQNEMQNEMQPPEPSAGDAHACGIKTRERLVAMQNEQEETEREGKYPNGNPWLRGNLFRSGFPGDQMERTHVRCYADHRFYSVFGYDPNTFTKLQCCVSCSMDFATRVSA